MQTEHIVALLVAERDRLQRAITALQGSAVVKRRGRPARAVAAAAPVSAPPVAAAAPAPKARKKRKALTPAQKKAHSERMKAFWAARRKAKAKG
jgi:hypothetical protein